MLKGIKNNIEHWGKIISDLTYPALEKKFDQLSATLKKTGEFSQAVFSHIAPESSLKNKGLLGKVLTATIINPGTAIINLITTPKFIIRYPEMKKMEDELKRLIEGQIFTNSAPFQSFDEKVFKDNLQILAHF